MSGVAEFGLLVPGAKRNDVRDGGEDRGFDAGVGYAGVQTAAAVLVGSGVSFEYAEEAFNVRSPSGEGDVFAATPVILLVGFQDGCLFGGAEVLAGGCRRDAGGWLGSGRVRRRRASRPMVMYRERNFLGSVYGCSRFFGGPCPSGDGCAGA